MKNNRINNVFEEMKNSDIPQMIISDPASIFYLTGKWINPGERLLALYLNVDGDHKIFINKLFPVTEDLGIEKIWFDDTEDAIEIIAKYVEKDKTIGIDKKLACKIFVKAYGARWRSRFCKLINFSR